MAFLTVAACALMPLASDAFVVPYLTLVWEGVSDVISADNLWIMSAVVLVMAAAILGGTSRRGSARRVDVYLAGVTADPERRAYRSSLSAPREATARNWYLEGLFGEARIAPVGTLLCSAVIVVAFLSCLIPPIVLGM